MLNITPSNKVAQTNFLKSITSSPKKGLGRKLLIAVLLISSIFTCAQSSYQLYSDYLLGLDEIDQRFEQTFISYKDSIARGIWNLNTDEIKLIASGILSLPNVEQVSIFEVSDANKKAIIELDTKSTADLAVKSTPIIFVEDESYTVGELQLKISLAPLYNDLYDKLLFILVFQTIKTFSVSILIFATFHYLVTQHLTTMANFSASISEDNLTEKLTLDRTPPKEKDELDAMADALNNAKNSMRKMLDYNEKTLGLKLELEKKEVQEQLTNSHSIQIEKKNSELETIISELKETQEQLINSEKMAVLGNMVKGVSHELNTPIGVSITGISHIQTEVDRIIELFDGSTMKRSDFIEFLDDSKNLGKSISISLKKAAELIQSFKLVSVEQHIDSVSEFNISNNFEDIIASLRHEFKTRNIEIINEIPEDLNIRSYPGIFYQIYTNLLNNANLHAFEGASSGIITLKASQPQNHVIIEFIDNGIGMSEEVKEQLFEPFFTTKRGSGGTGLGMNIVRTLINEKLQGTVVVSTELEKGTSYIITLPNLEII